MSERKKKDRKPERQEWKPNLVAQILYRAWMAVFGVAKIAVGAVATVTIILAVCALAFATALGNYLTDEIIPNSGINLDEFTLEQTSFIYYTDSNDEIKLLQQIHTATDRQWADFEDIPKNLINATVAIEDKRFYEHQGVDWFTTIKAFANMFLGDDSKGGSTITQQLVKNLTQDDSVTVQRKLMELFRATEMERRYNKDTIMEWYLNYIYLGHGCYGVRSAAEYYYGKELEMLTIAECASLISITNNPSVYDPYGDTWEYISDETGELVVTTGVSRNNVRKSWTLGEMVTQGLITWPEYREAMDQEIVFKKGVEEGDRLTTCINEFCGYKNIASTFKNEDGVYYCPICDSKVTVRSDASRTVYSWFVDTVLEDVAKAMCERDGLEWSTDKNGTRTLYLDMIARSGYHIYTTLDMDVQEQVDRIYENLDEIPETRSGQQMQSAMVVIDNETGDIIAMAGGVGEKTVHDAWNIATDATLQTGSSIKPLTVYAPAFETGAITPATVVKDLPIRYDAPNHMKPYPNNANDKFSGSNTVQNSIRWSHNTIAAQVLQEIGAEFSYDFGKNELGLHSFIDRYVDRYGVVHDDVSVSSLAMGSQVFGLTVREMSCAYATFANEGVYREGRTFTKVFDSEGNLILENQQDSREVFSKKTVDYVNSCLFDVVYKGTGTEADMSDHYVYGKTGTTNDAKDQWFCGYTDYYTAAVWCGYNDPETIITTTVSNPAAVLWRKVMRPLHNGLDMVRLYNNYDFTTQTICLDSGLLATDACKADYRGLTRTDDVRVYWEDRVTETCTSHVMMDICPETGYVANEWCQHFASEEYKDEATRLKLEKKALVKITEDDLEELGWTQKHGLRTEFMHDGWVYLVDSRGRDVKDYHGFVMDKYGDLVNKVNEDLESPYAVCQVHTQEAWEAYLATQIPEPTVPVDPTVPGESTVPGEPTVPGAPEVPGTVSG